MTYGLFLLPYICPDTCLGSTLSKCPWAWLISWARVTGW